MAFPELVISGYPPEDLLLKDHFLARLPGRAAARWPRPTGHLRAGRRAAWPRRRGVYNAAAVLAGGRVAGVYRKICLPNYAVFDEKRYFTPGDRTGVAGLRRRAASG